MLNFQDLTVNEFLLHYWQKKPLVIRKALPEFIPPIDADELAGLALEEDIESRMVFQTPDNPPYWHLKKGPFKENDFKTVAKTHWTLLVQGVDRFVPGVNALLDHFNFIPQWRVDDVMISYAAEHGGVGPHYDNYDVFLFQAQGRRKWSLTSQHCFPDNYLDNVPLRIMEQFIVEEEFILEEGDMLYLPPHIGHNGVALSPDCMTYSFGFRSYQALEVWDSFGEYLAEQPPVNCLYKDPSWANLKGSSEITPEAVANAKKLLLSILEDDKRFQTWFGCFATQLDQQAEVLLPIADEMSEDNFEQFMQDLKASKGLIRHPLCRLAYQSLAENNTPVLFINGCYWDTTGVTDELITFIANCRTIRIEALQAFLNHQADQRFLYALWSLQWVNYLEE